MESNEALKKYCENTSKEICERVFAGKKFVSGEDILSLTPITQLNLIIVKNLFFTWKLEMENSRSPYFDYENSDVKRAFKNYSNILSKNIKITKDDFNPLVYNSLVETINLIYSPYNYLLFTIDKLKNGETSKKQLEDTQKYIKVNKNLLEGLIQFLNTNDFSNKTSEEIASIILDDITSEPEETRIFTDLFNSINNLNPEILFVELSEEKPYEATVETTNPELQNSNPPEIEKSTIEKFVPSSTIEPDRPRMILNDIYQVDQKQTIADIHQKKNIESIKKSLTLNQRFMFINNLFDGNTEKFNQTIDVLDGSSSFQQAFEYLNTNFTWKDEEEGLEEFMTLVNKKFNG